MSKKLRNFATFLIIFLFIVNLVLAVLLLVRGASAATVVPCPGDTCPPEGKIRVQVAVPGLSETCTYNDKGNIVMDSNGSAKIAVRACHYVESLPAFVAKFYKFSIGLISILAVIMIMYGGLQWIFASGNLAKVSSAKESITAAITGLVLALTSYVILYNINPNLVNLKLPGATAIKTIEQPTGGTWCNNFPQYYQNDTTKPMVFYLVGQWGRANAEATRSSLNCSKNYEYGYRNGGNLVKIEGTCSGSLCPDQDRICFSESGYNSCKKPEEKCQEMNPNNCDIINMTMDTSITKKEFLNKACVKENNKALDKDSCVWGDIIYCPGGTTKVDCFSGPSKDGNDGCWTLENNGAKKPVTKTVTNFGYFPELTCTSDVGLKQTSLICCYNPGSGKYKAYGDVTAVLGYVPGKAYIPNCKNNSIRTCADYQSEDAKAADPCKVCK